MRNRPPGSSARLLTEPFLARGWDLPAISPKILDLLPGTLAVPGFHLDWRVQERHSAPTLAFRINDSVAYCTDTAYDPGNIAVARGCRTLVHEAWCTTDAPQGLDSHSSAADAAGLAKSSQVEKLIMIHINPAVADRRLRSEAATVFKESVVGEDLMEIDC